MVSGGAEDGAEETGMEFIIPRTGEDCGTIPLFGRWVFHSLPLLGQLGLENRIPMTPPPVTSSLSHPHRSLPHPCTPDMFALTPIQPSSILSSSEQSLRGNGVGALEADVNAGGA